VGTPELCSCDEPSPNGDPKLAEFVLSEMSFRNGCSVGDDPSSPSQNIQTRLVLVLLVMCLSGLASNCLQVSPRKPLRVQSFRTSVPLSNARAKPRFMRRSTVYTQFDEAFRIHQLNRAEIVEILTTLCSPGN